LNRLATDDAEEASGGWQLPTEDEIRQRAYEIHLKRERECGGPLDDWLEAEAELLLKRKGSQHLAARTEAPCREKEGEAWTEGDFLE
jgi:hypothetical protein